MAYATLTADFADTTVRKGFFAQFLDSFVAAKKFERMYSLSDAQLAARGLNRDTMVQSYIAGLAAQD